MQQISHTIYLFLWISLFARGQHDDRQIAAESQQIFALLNSEVAPPIFTKISNDVEAL